MKKFLFVFLMPFIALAQLSPSELSADSTNKPPVLKYAFEITKTYNPHFRTIYEVRVNESVCEFYTLDPLRIYWKNAKKGDRVEELDDGEHEKLDPIFIRKTAHQIEFQIKSVPRYGLNYPLTIDLVRTGDKCEPVVSGQHLKVVKNVHVIIKFFKARQLIINGIGLDGRPHSVRLQVN